MPQNVFHGTYSTNDSNVAQSVFANNQYRILMYVVNLKLQAGSCANVCAVGSIERESGKL